MIGRINRLFNTRVYASPRRTMYNLVYDMIKLATDSKKEGRLCDCPGKIGTEIQFERITIKEIKSKEMIVNLYQNETEYVEDKKDGRFWYKNGKLHRDGDLPAVEHVSGIKVWYLNGLLHRDGDLPAVVYPDGSVEYWREGIRQQI